MQETKKQKLLAEAKELIGKRRFVKASFLYDQMNITGAMAASLLRGLGFKKISNRVWEKIIDEEHSVRMLVVAKT